MEIDFDMHEEKNYERWQEAKEERALRTDYEYFIKHSAFAEAVEALQSLKHDCINYDWDWSEVFEEVQSEI